MSQLTGDGPLVSVEPVAATLPMRRERETDKAIRRAGTYSGPVDGHDCPDPEGRGRSNEYACHEGNLGMEGILAGHSRAGTGWPGAVARHEFPEGWSPREPNGENLHPQGNPGNRRHVH